MRDYADKDYLTPRPWREVAKAWVAGLAFTAFVFFALALVDPRPDLTYAHQEAEKMKALARMRAAECAEAVGHERMCLMARK